MQLIFDNNWNANIVLNNTKLAIHYKKVFRYLGAVPLPFKDWHNPYYTELFSLPQRVEKLIFFAEKLNIDVDKAACLRQDREYFNELHKIYEKNYNGNTQWMDYHDLVHLCGPTNTSSTVPSLFITHQEKNGPLIIPFDITHLKDSTTSVTAGTVYVRWHELGKSPYEYWQTKEPNDINRICELGKPWVWLKPNFYIALENINLIPNDLEQFDIWWRNYHDDWCRHWKLDHWGAREIFSMIPIGSITALELDNIKKLLKSNHVPTNAKIVDGR